MDQNEKPSFRLSAAIPAIFNAVIAVFGVISPFLSLSDEVLISINSRRQYFALFCGIIAVVTIFYLMIERANRRQNWIWWISLLAACFALMIAIMLPFVGIQVEYRFRDREYTEALTDQLDGWTMERKEEIPMGKVIYLDDWSTEKPEKGNAEQKEEWRFRTKQTTQATAQPDGSWTLDSSAVPVTNTGEWSDDPIPGQNTESATLFRYREVQTSSEKTYRTLGWTRENPGQIKQQYQVLDWEEREVLWHYFQFYCKSCGHVQRDFDGCSHCGAINSMEYNECWETVPYDDLNRTLEGWATLKKGNDTYFANVDPKNWTVETEPKKEYLYTVVEDSPSTAYGKWSDWSFENPGNLGDLVQIEQKTVYRVSEEIRTYYRWSDWSGWSASRVSENDNTQVEHRILYRPYEEETKTVYHFSRWGDWSEWTVQKPEESENRDVQSRRVKAEPDAQAENGH